MNGKANLYNRQITTPVIYLFSILLLIAIAGASLYTQLPAERFTKDIASIAGLHPTSGILSSLGVLTWCITASICFFAALFLHKMRRYPEYSLLFNTGLLTSYLTLDDAFLIHERLAPDILRIDEKVVYAILLVFILFYLKSFWLTILRTRYSLFIASLILLGSSLILDVLPWPEELLGGWQYLLEDGLKWLGIVSWCIYFVKTSFDYMVDCASNADSL